MAQKIELELNRTINMLMAHPDNEPNSEFSDRIDSLIDLKEQLILSGVSQRSELLAFLDILENMPRVSIPWDVKMLAISKYLKS